MTSALVAEVWERLADLEVHSPWRHVSQDSIDAFARLSGDHQWIHVDPSRALTDGPYGSTVAHGGLVLALMPVMVLQALPWADSWVLINAGVDRARFHRPVPAGADVRASGHVRSVLDAGAGCLVEIDMAMESRGEPRKVCSLRQRVLVNG